MKVWSFVSQKGGAGKSTLATQIGALAQFKGERVAIVDLDPQGSATAWSKIRGDRMPEAFKALPTDLKRLIEGGKDYGYTLLLVDTAPHSRADTIDAVKQSDMIICPTRSAMFDLMAMRDTVEILNLCGRRQLAFGVINGVAPPKKGKSGKVAIPPEYDHAITFLKELELRTCTTYVRQLKAFTDAIAKGKGVTEQTAQFKEAAADIEALYKELLLLVPSNVVQLKGKSR